jgi:D-alanine-D-alanine ligase
VVFIALHGTYGEDGTVQRMLEQLGIPYVGSGPYSSAIAMNKAMAKDRVQHHGVLLPRHVMLSPDVLSSLQSTVEDIISLFGPHYIIKPVTGGSSIGTRRALGEHELSHALSQALRSYEQVLVEELITGREATVGVIDNYRGVPLYTLPPVEIRTAPSGLFDYENKYGDESLEHCPSHFSHQTKVELERLARTVHSALDLRHYSRSDFIVADDGIYFLEVNTLPGLTKASLIPKALHTVGGTMEHFLDHLLTEALESRSVVMR